MKKIQNNCPNHPGAELRNIDNEHVRCSPTKGKCKWTRPISK